MANDTEVGALRVMIEARLDKLETGLKNAERMVQKSGERIGKSLDFGAMLAKGFAALGTIEAGFKLATAAAQAMRGDVEGIRAAVTSLPMGIGPVVKAAWDLHDVLSGTAEKLAEKNRLLDQQAKLRDINLKSAERVATYEADSVSRMRTIDQQLALIGKEGLDRDILISEQREENAKREARTRADEARKAAVEELKTHEEASKQRMPPEQIMKSVYKGSGLVNGGGMWESVVDVEATKKAWTEWGNEKIRVLEQFHEKEKRIRATYDKEISGIENLGQEERSRAREQAEEKRAQELQRVNDEQAREQSRIAKELADTERRNLEQVADAESQVKQKQFEAEGKQLEARLEQIEWYYEKQIMLAREAGNQELVERMEILRELERAEAHKQFGAEDGPGRMGGEVKQIEAGMFSGQYGSVGTIDKLKGQAEDKEMAKESLKVLRLIAKNTGIDYKSMVA